ncbi:glycoside hydrolase family 99-like domain-containing protein [Pedobacter sp. MW01-1-1]|uniref:glycoside hydrolase family 99-like domain-containing protein n=1 Tax=Pedobacter sp. MW01-1-1 TaxID=3383027 RepID=UPI003FF098E1
MTANFFRIVLCVFLSADLLCCDAQNKVQIGAYYFDGWTGVYPYHLTKSLQDNFSEREPKWGWMTSSQAIMNKQIQEATNAGLSFFSFCWYYPDGKKYTTEPLNNSLNYFVKSPISKRMKFCLMVANHQGFLINRANWSSVCSEWLGYFKKSNYLNVAEKPLLIFFSLQTLIDGLGGVDAVSNGLDSLRIAAKDIGLKGVSIAVCIDGNPKNTALAKACGFDLLTGYNYHQIALNSAKKEVPIEKLQISEMNLWSSIANQTTLPYIPVTTLGWDPRPWANKSNKYDTAPYYAGLSPLSVANSVSNCIKWLRTNKAKTTKEQIALLYAWNEYGEGAYLTPSKNGTNLLKYIKKTISNAP